MKCDRPSLLEYSIEDESDPGAKSFALTRRI